MTIEERAKAYADNYCVGDAAFIVDLIHKCALESYTQGATEQRAIDIDNHWNWIKAFANVTMGIDISAYEDMFKKKAMEDHG